MSVLQQMLVFFFIMLLGRYLARKGILDQNTNQKMAKIIVDFSNPALVLSAGSSANIQLSVANIVHALTLAVLYFFILIGLGQFLPYIMRIQREDYNIYRCMIVFSNIGFMGLPIVAAIYGSKSLLYASLFQIPYDCLIYTYGVAILRSPSQENKRKLAPRDILNNGILACISAVAISMSGLHLPALFCDTVSMVGDLTGPISMMLIGASLATIHLLDLFTDIKLLIFTSVKLCIIPLISITALKFFGMDLPFIQASVIMMSAPVGSMVAMFTQLYDGDYQLAAKGVSLTTVVSVVTMPLMVLYANWFVLG